MAQIISNYMELEMADLDPVAIYAELRKHSADAFMFESVEGSEKLARYTFVGFRALEILKSGSYDELAHHIEAMAASNELPFFHKGYVGFFTFESVADIEPKLRCAIDKSPHMYMQLVGTMVVFDRILKKIYLISNSFADAINSSALDELKILVEGAKSLADLTCDTKITLADMLKSPEAVEFKSNTSEQQFYTMVAKAKQHILDGDVFQVVLSRKLSADTSVDPLLLYRLLRIVNPSPYLFIYNVRDFAGSSYSLVGSSPEMLVKSTLQDNADGASQIVPVDLLRNCLEQGLRVRGSGVDSSVNEHAEDEQQESSKARRMLYKDSTRVCEANAVIGNSVTGLVEYQAEIRPIAGTYSRGKTAEEDEYNARTLLADEKECAEHVMLIDLARNDLGRVARSGTVTVAQQMIIEKYSHVMHIVSSVIAKLRSGLDPKANARLGIDLLKACFPAGTLSGAPKLEAIDIITELEQEPRRSYGGAIGYFSLDGRVDTAIMIRTLVVEPHRVHVQAGAGIVADSIAESEHRETYNKASALIKVVNLAKQQSCKSR